VFSHEKTENLSQCAGKKGYVTYDEASGVLKSRRFRSKNKVKHTRLVIYRCRHCACWHIGSTGSQNKDDRR